MIPSFVTSLNKLNWSFFGLKATTYGKYSLLLFLKLPGWMPKYYINLKPYLLSVLAMHINI